MKKLPKVFQNDFSKTINNNKKVCYLRNEALKEEITNTPVIENKQDIINTLDEVFSGIGYAYNIPLEIKTSTKEYNTSLIAKTSNNIITLDNEIIPISDIISINIKNNSK